MDKTSKPSNSSHKPKKFFEKDKSLGYNLGNLTVQFELVFKVVFSPNGECLTSVLDYRSVEGFK